MAEDLVFEALELSIKYEESSEWEDQIHKIPMVFGRISLRQGDTDQAIEYLLAAGEYGDGYVSSSFGPNMLLPKELIEGGESAAVPKYLELCKEYWDSAQGRISLWTKQISDGETPEFGINLSY